MHYVYSTSTCSGTYCLYAPANSSGGHAIIKKKVTIQGGHKVATPYKGLNNIAVHTPNGVLTPVSDEDMEFLLQNKSFLRHVAAGHLSYDKKKVDTEVKVKNMTQEDASSPLTPAHFDKGENSNEDSPIYKANLQKNPKVKAM